MKLFQNVDYSILNKENIRFMRFCNHNIMLLWVKTRILTFLDLGGMEGKSSTVTTRHVTASQNWVEIKPKTLLCHSEAKNQWEVWYRTFDIASTLCLVKLSLWTNASPYFDFVCSRQCRRHLDTHSLLILIIMINKKWFTALWRLQSMWKTVPLRQGL